MIVSWETFFFFSLPFASIASHSDRSLTATSPIVLLLYICNIYPTLQSENLSTGFCISLSHVLPFSVAVFWLSSHIADMADWARMPIRNTESTEYSVNGIQGPLHSIQTLLCIAAAISYDSSLLIRMITYDLLICHTEYWGKLSWVVRFDTSSAWAGLCIYRQRCYGALDTLLQLRLVKPSTRNSAIHHGMGYGWCKFTASHQPVNSISVSCLQVQHHYPFFSLKKMHSRMLSGFNPGKFNSWRANGFIFLVSWDET